MSVDAILWSDARMRGNLYLIPLRKKMLTDGVTINRDVGDFLPVPVLFEKTFIIAKFKKQVIDDMDIETSEELETVIDLLRNAFNEK